MHSILKYLYFVALLLTLQISNAEEKKDCNEYKKLSTEYLSCMAKKLKKNINENLKIDGKSPEEVKEEIKNL